MWTRKRRSEPGTDGRVSTTERDQRGRGWGPFTGGQLTLIIVVFVAAVLVPVGTVGAITASQVFITDPHTHAQAVVNSDGRLETAGIANHPNTLVHGSTTAYNSGNCAKVYTAPANRAAVFTTVIINTVQYSGATGVPVLQLRLNDPACNNVAGSRFVANLSAASDTVAQDDLDVSPGFAVPPGKSLYVNMVDVSFGGVITTEVTVFGYALPAADCANAC